MPPLDSSPIRNFDALSEDHMPEDIVARETQIAEMRACLSPAERGLKPIHAWLHGRPGTGKTTIARYVTSQLEHNTRVESVYVNCWQHSTLFMVLQGIVEALRIIVPDNANTVVKLHRIRSKMKSSPLIVVLDEIDKTEPKERDRILYTLSSVSTVGTVAISNSRSSLFELEDRVRSRLGPTLIAFDPYRVQDLYRILEARVKLSLAPTAYSAEVIERIATLAAGDARVAIQTLLKAAQLAESQGTRTISVDQITEAASAARKLKTQYTLAKMTEHHKLLYDLVVSAPQTTTSVLWASYQQRCQALDKRPIAERTFNLYIHTLVVKGLIERERAAVLGNVYTVRPAA
ncbi:MAG: family ATPase [Bacteroidetes bacterium]|nr:family ATPase [Bacteroidota bacterium]